MHDLRERLVAFYRGRGYLLFDVAVAVEEPSAGRTPLIVTVVEGKRGYIKDVRFSGNRGLGEKELRGQMTTRGRGPFHWITSSGEYREENWNDDLNAIVGLYQKSGYARTKVLGGRQHLGRRRRDRENDSGRGGAAIPGPEIVFLGNRSFLRAEFLRKSGTRRGGKRTSTTPVRRPIRRRGRALIADSGYLDVRVSRKALFDAEPSSVRRFMIVEGPRYRLGNIVVRGTLSPGPRRSCARTDRAGRDGQ